MKKLALLCSCLVSAFLAYNAGAAFTTWDPQAANAQNPYLGNMTGTWESATWSTLTTQGGMATPVHWPETGTACIFGVNTGLGTPAYTVTMNANHTVAGFFVGLENPNSCTVTVNGTGVITLSSGAQGMGIIQAGDGSAGNLTISNVIAGSGQMAMESSGNTPGQLFLCGANTFTGGITMGYAPGSVTWTGTVNFGNNNAFGTGTIVLQSVGNGSTLAAMGTGAYTITNAVNVASSANNTIVGTPAGVAFSGPWTLGTSALQLGSGGAGNLVTISGNISGTSTFTKVGAGTLGLSAANTFSGTVAVNSGILQLIGSGSINNASTLSIGTNSSGSGTLDVSQLPSPYTLSSTTTLAASGNGDGSGGSPATIVGASGGVVNLGSQPIHLTFSGSSGLGSSCLYVSQGSLTLNNNTITVNNATPAQLVAGTYSLIRVGDGFTGTITGNPNPNVIITGNGLAPGYAATVQVGSGIGDASDVDLIVTALSSTVTIAPFAAVTHGTAPSITVTVSPDPTADPLGGGLVQFYTNGVADGSAVPVVTGGTASITDPNIALFAPGTYTVYGAYTGSGGGVYAPGNSQTLRMLVTAGMTESVVYYDNNGTSMPTSGSFDTNPNWADGTAWTPDTYVFPSGGTAVTTSSGNNLLTLTVNSAITLGGITNNGSGGESNVISGTGSIVLNPGSPATSTIEYTATGNDQTTITVPITGTGALMHMGAGTGANSGTGNLNLYGNNSYSGGTYLKGGVSTVNINNNNSFGTGPIIWGDTYEIIGVPANDGAGNTGATGNIVLTNAVMANSGGEFIFLGTSTSALLFSGPWTLYSSGTNYIAPQTTSANLTITGTISGAADLATLNRSLGNGSLYLWGSNTYTGGTTLNTGGGVNFNSSNSFGTGSINWGVNGCVLATPVNDGSGNATGATGPFTITNKVNPGTAGFGLTLAGNPAAPVTWSGPWPLVGANTTSNVFTVITAAGLTGTTTTTISGVISGTAGFKKAGAGTLVLSGANTYGGVTTISAGILSVNAIADTGTSAIGTAGTLLLNGGELQYTGAGAATTARLVTVSGTASSVDLPAGNLTLSGQVKSGTITKTSGGTLTLSGTLDNSSLGVTVAAGTVVFAKNSGSTNHSVGATTTINSGATLQLGGTGGDQIYMNVTVNNNGTFDMEGLNESFSLMTGTGTVQNSGAATSALQLGENAASGTFGGIIQDTIGKISLTKTNTGAIVLSGINAYTGGTTILGGTLEISGSIMGNVTNTGGVLKLDNTTALASSATVTLAASPAAGAVNLNFSGTQNVTALYYGGVQKAYGTWGGTGSGAANIDPAFTGTGVLNVVSPSAPPYSISSGSVNVAAGTFTLTWATTPGFTYHVIHGAAGTARSTWATVPGSTFTASGPSTSYTFPIGAYGSEQLFTVVSP